MPGRSLLPVPHASTRPARLPDCGTGLPRSLPCRAPVVNHVTAPRCTVIRLRVASELSAQAAGAARRWWCDTGRHSPAAGWRPPSRSRRPQRLEPLYCSAQPEAGSSAAAGSSEAPQSRRGSWQGWEVPWGFWKTCQVMLVWVFCFWLLGYMVIPGGLSLLGLEREDLSNRGQALVSLLLDVGEMGVTLGILWQQLKGFRPLAPGWFRCSLRPLRSWLPAVALACLAFPLVEQAAVHSQAWFPAEGELWGANLLEQCLAQRDLITNALYFFVVTICAPLWEEAIFRGFLLPSLTRFMPVAAAVLVSSVVFALAHFSLQRFLPLLMLGILMGGLFARTRNLLSSVALHSLWNMFIFYQLAVRGGGL